MLLRSRKTRHHREQIVITKLFHKFLFLLFFFLIPLFSEIYVLQYNNRMQIGKRSWKLTCHYRYILVHASFILVFIPVFLKKKRDCASPFQRSSLEFIVGIRRRATLISIYSTKVWSLGRFFSIYLKTPL